MTKNIYLAQENLSRKKRTRKSQKMDTDDVDDGVKQILALHPLSVKICVNTKGKHQREYINVIFIENNDWLKQQYRHYDGGWLLIF